MGSILKIIAGAIGLLDKLAAALQRRQDKQAGVTEQRAADIAKESEIKSDQLQAAVDGPRDRDAVADRLRSGRF